jgi:hypothetical protein
MTCGRHLSATWREKRVNEMNCLTDITHIPVTIYAGETSNVLLTIYATWWIHHHYWELKYLLVWLIFVILANTVPILVLRVVTLRRTSDYPNLSEMRFFHDQHKLADWVYIVASANLSFWIVVSWVFFTYINTYKSLITVLTISFLCTFSPGLAGFIRKMAKLLITRKPNGTTLSSNSGRHPRRI